MKKKPIRVCLIATEFKGIGAYGGFGVLTHDIAHGLTAKGLEVSVVMPQKEGQNPKEQVGAVSIFSYPSPLYEGIKLALPHKKVYEATEADVYHSEEPSLGTAVAQLACPHKKHLVTFQDPRNLQDWQIEWAHGNRNLNKLRKLRWHYGVLKWYIKYQMQTGRAARRANAKFCQAKFIIEKVRKMYRLESSPGFLPNPIRMANGCSPKASSPTVCYIGRWDERKRPELFLELAERFKTINFIAVGGCLTNKTRDTALRERCRALNNVEAPGWLGEKERAAILDKSWIMVNTSTRECLPVTYLEAGVHNCAILSHCNADEFASSFGYWAQKGDLDDYAEGLNSLLVENRWRMLGEKACDYVRNTHEFDRVIDQHVEAYERILGRC